MRRVILAAITLLVHNVQAQEFGSPEDLLSTFYQAYLSAPITNFEPYFSSRLTKEMNGGRLDNGALQRLGFDPITGANEPTLVTVFDLETTEAVGLTATSIATFRSGSELVTVSFELVREHHGWQIDHISGRAGDRSWCTNDLVAAVQALAR